MEIIQTLNQNKINTPMYSMLIKNSAKHLIYNIMLRFKASKASISCILLVKPPNHP